jgi:hypothetical protein
MANKIEHDTEPGQMAARAASGHDRSLALRKAATLRRKTTVDRDSELRRRVFRATNNTNPGALYGPAIAIPLDRTDDVDPTVHNNGDDIEVHSTSAPSRSFHAAS